MNHPVARPDTPPGQAATMEQHLVAQLAALAPEGVHLVDTIHRSLDASLFWSTSADAFVSIWGAGLAKYRWIANKPGLVISGRWNMRNRHDVHIYDDPTYMEAPKPLSMVPAELVEDVDAGDNQLNLANFDVDMTGWLTVLDGFLAESFRL